MLAKPFLIGLLLTGLSLVLPAQAVTFQTRMENVSWDVTGDQFECRLSQTIEGYGEAVFVRRAGERPTFRLNALHNPMSPGQAQVWNEAPLWRPGTNAQLVGQAQVREGSLVMTLPEQPTARLLAGLSAGLLPTVQRSSWGNAQEPVRVVVSSVGYNDAWERFRSCFAGLLPMNFDQVSNSVISFASGGSQLTGEARTVLDAVLAYFKADDQIKGIQLDGHSDNQGNRLDNRELSRQRALAVQSYLVERGVPEDLFTIRFHGERYPVANNRTTDGRAQNRRVGLRLDRE